MDFDIVIKNGKVIDGTHNPWFKADIAVKDGKIAEISRIPISRGSLIIDAKGLAVSPGFFDMHSHSDRTIFTNNRCESTLHGGVTSVAAGQCGGSVWPKTDSGTWDTLAEYREALRKKGIGANLVPQVGHNTIRTVVMGAEGKGGERFEPTSDEMKKMKGYLEQSMKDGSFALTAGLCFPPGRNAFTDEVIELCKIVAKYGGYFTAHLRSEDIANIEACRELIEICEKAGVRGSYTHHKCFQTENWGKVVETMRMLDRARERGVEFYCDVYCQIYAAESNAARWFFPHLIRDDPKAPLTVDELLDNLRDPEKWEKVKNATRKEYQDLVHKNLERKKELGKKFINPGEIRNPDTFDFIVYSKTHPELFGKNLRESAQILGIEDPFDARRKIVLDDKGFTYECDVTMSEDDVIAIIKHPATCFSTDGSAHDDYPPSYPLKPRHPREYGVFAKVLGRYVRDMKILSLEDAVRKMTSLPAQFIGLTDRGLLREGYWADIVLFDPVNIRDISTFANAQYPEGIPYVIVNGQVVIDHGKHTGALPGKVLSNKH